jgi:hypothetical protein
MNKDVVASTSHIGRLDEWVVPLQLPGGDIEEHVFSNEGEARIYARNHMPTGDFVIRRIFHPPTYVTVTVSRPKSGGEFRPCDVCRRGPNGICTRCGRSA